MKLRAKCEVVLYRDQSKYIIQEGESVNVIHVEGCHGCPYRVYIDKPLTKYRNRPYISEGLVRFFEIVDESAKPPKGLVPRDIHVEMRIDDIWDAIKRHKESGREIPDKWIDEYNELVNIYHVT